MLQLLQDLAVDPEEPVGSDNPLRQVIVNTHSPSVVAEVPDDSLLVAQVAQDRVGGQRNWRLTFSPLPDTWRSRIDGSTPPIPRGVLQDYLNPLRGTEPPPRIGPIFSTARPSNTTMAGRRVSGGADQAGLHQGARAARGAALRATAAAPHPLSRPSRPAPRLGRALAAVLLALAPHGRAAADPTPEAAYALDSVTREVPPKGPLRCPKVDLVDYKGDVLKLSSTAKVFSGFRDRLKELEKVARDVGAEVYGRPPTRVVHLGTYSCRRIAAYPEWLSEHALGNAIDIAGFDFGPLAKGESLPEGLPRPLKNAFEVRVLSHWKAKSGHATVHARFLKTLAQRLIARRDIFRVLLGPGYPGHDDHFHFDLAPFRMVEIYEEGQRLAAPPPADSPP